MSPSKFFTPSRLFRSVLPDLMRKRAIPANGVLHIGAHLGEEVSCYQSMGFKKIVLVEPNPKLCAAMRAKGYEVRECAVSSEPGPLGFNIVMSDVGSSLLPLLPNPHLSAHVVERVIQVPVCPLSDILEPEFNLLIVDTQGTSLDVVQSGPLSQFDIVITEVHKGTPLYADESDWRDVVAYMESQGFYLEHTHVNGAKHHVYEDLIFLRR